MEELRASVKRQRADSRTRSQQRQPSMSEHEDSLRKSNEENGHSNREGLKPKSDTINSSKTSTYQPEVTEEHANRHKRSRSTSRRKPQRELPDQAYLPDGEEERLMIEREKHVWSKLQVSLFTFRSIFFCLRFLILLLF